MRALAHSEAAVRELLEAKVRQGQMTERDAVRLFNWGFRTAITVIGNLRTRKADDDQINAFIQRKIRDAKTAIRTARTLQAQNMGAREFLLAQMYAAVWRGMQEDVAAYQTTR
jgi:hypothetical protein